MIDEYRIVVGDLVGLVVVGCRLGFRDDENDVLGHDDDEEDKCHDESDDGDAVLLPSILFWLIVDIV